MKVKSDKIFLLLQDNFSLEIGNALYAVFVYKNYTLIQKHTLINNDVWHEEFSIRFGDMYKTTLKDIKPVLAVLNIEFEYPKKQYKLKNNIIYTQEQIEALVKIGLEFEEVSHNEQM
jgi:hypothetical protein